MQDAAVVEGEYQPEPLLAWDRRGWILGLGAGLAGMAFVVAPAVTGGRIPGDLYDTRLNSFLLEHVYRWIIGLDASFLSNRSYFPFPLATAIGDNFLGDGPLYAFFRSSGADREAAFNLWYAAGFVANYAAAHVALARLGYSRIASAIGAFLFAFGLPVTGQEIHSQLAYRFGVPLAVLCLIRLRKGGSLFHAAAMLFWLTWQLFCSIYIGYFLALLLLALWLSTTGKPRFESDWTMGSWLPRRWPSATRFERLVPIAACAVLIAAIVLFMAPYAEVSRLYGFKRSWSEISEYLPRPQSYLMAYRSRLWPSSGGLFDRIPRAWEHGMFIGGAPYLAMAVAWALRARGKAAPDPIVRPMAIAIALLAVLTLCNDPLYQLLVQVPGVSAIRSVTRIILVMLFPFAIILASAVDGVLGSRLELKARFTLVGLAAALLVVESADVDHMTTTVGQWRARLASVRALLPARLPPSPILFVSPSRDEFFIRDADAMITAQDRGWQTINGFSFPRPPGYVNSGVCSDVERDLAAGLAFRRETELNLPLLRSRVVLAGFPNCVRKAQDVDGNRRPEAAALLYVADPAVRPD